MRRYWYKTLASGEKKNTKKEQYATTLIQTGPRKSGRIFTRANGTVPLREPSAGGGRWRGGLLRLLSNGNIVFKYLLRATYYILPRACSYAK